MTNEEITLQELLFRQHFATTFAILQYSALFHVASKKFSEADSGGIIRLINDRISIATVIFHP